MIITYIIMSHKKDNYMDANAPYTVTDLELALKDKIKYFKGGITAIWKQIDERFKDLDKKSITGERSRNSGKIRWEAFRKAYQRLGNNYESANLEKMTFGIKGNPLLLMNIFEILGINGLKDLKNPNYKRPDTLDEIVYIDIGIDEINKKIEALDDKINNIYPKSIKTMKLNADFEEILNRMYSIHIDNTDLPLENKFFIWLKNNSTMIESMDNIVKAFKSFNPEELLKSMKIYNMINNSNTVQNKIINLLFKNKQPELQRVALFMMLFNEYKEYILHDKMLLKHLKLIMEIDINDNNFICSNTFILSPLYIIFFFLRIAHIFIKKSGYKSILSDDEAKEYLLVINDDESIENYMLKITKELNTMIKTILAYLTKNDITDIPKENYIKYLNMSQKVICFYHDIFVKNKTINDDDFIKKYSSMSTIRDFTNLKYYYITGIYKISSINIETIEKIKNEISIIVKETGKDIYE